MPLSSNLSIAPYYDAYDPSKDYYRVLFQPSVSVQTRELNELQDLFQAQVERFGDNIFESGTIVTGCSFSFDRSYYYAKINDLTTDNTQANPSAYVGMYATSQNGLKAYIKNYANGYQSQDPNLKTLYFDYLVPSSNGDIYFSSGDVLSISSPQNQILGIDINNPGQGYSNSDTLIFVPIIAVNKLVGSGFSNGELLIQPSTNARAVIISINSTAYSDRTLLGLAPYSTDLGNTSLTTTPWALSNTFSVQGSTSNTTATVIDIFGTGASGQVITDGAGHVVNTVITTSGFGYRLPPYATIKPATNPAAISTSLSLNARNYLTKVTVTSTANAVGNGYAMSVANGVIYQKGYFLQSNTQTIVVSKYNSVPDQVSVVFTTTESIITPQLDNSLYDNALGTTNYTAPGANRLQLVPTLSLVNTNAVSSDQLALVSFSEGLPYLQNQYTKYNQIENELASRTYEEAGNFVIDKFNVTTRSPVLSTNVSQISVITEPGTGYISGYRVSLNSDYVTGINKGTNTTTSNSTIVSLNYDNYIRIKEIGGSFGFNVGGQVTFYDTAKTFLSNTQLSLSGNTLPVGNIVATASIRSLTYEAGIPGTNTATYKLYLFNLTPSVGKSFATSRSVYYTNGVQAGIADIVLNYNAQSNTYSANVVGNTSTLIFSPSLGRIQSVANVSYIYRTVNNSITLANTGSATISVVANPGERFPYSGNLTSIQLSDLYVVPLSNNVISANSVAGTSTVNTTSNVMIGVGTSYGTDVLVGDYIYLANSTSSTTKQVTSIVNSTYATLDSIPSFAFAANLVYHAYPQDIPIPFNSRSWLSANVNSNGAILTLTTGPIQSATSANLSVAYNVQRTNVSSGTKTALRNNTVRIYTGNNAGGSVGPWCLGVADVIRLKGVYISNSTANTGNVANAITTSFYIDNNQNGDMLNLCYLYANPAAKISLANTYLLVNFDVEEISVPGFFTTDSYTTANITFVENNDSVNSNLLSNTMCTWEIPEFNDDNDNNYDLMEYIDFRPIASPTANLSAITLNPSYSNVFSTSSDWKFPLPGSSLTANVTYYNPRIDSVVLTVNGSISIITGVPSQNPKAPRTPNNSMLLDQLLVPAYPTLPANPSAMVVNNAMTMMGSNKVNTTRYKNSIISSVLTSFAQIQAQPSGYTMADIANLERRIAALEYEVSLNSLEVSVANMNIPSSIANSVNRFIYGFYADDYSTNNFVDQGSIEWSATLDNEHQRLYPKGDALNLPHSSVKSPRFIEFPVVTQSVATNPVQPCSLTVTETVYQTAGRRSTQIQQILWWNIYSDEQYKFTMGSTPGTATLYFCGLDPFYTIFQGNTVVAGGNNAVSLTEADIDYMVSQPFFASIPWYHGFSNMDQALHGEPLIHYADGAVSGAGKISWTHNPANGLDYTVDVTNFSNGNWAIGYWAYQVVYPVDSSTYIDCARLVDGTPVPVLMNVSEIVAKSANAFSNPNIYGGGYSGIGDVSTTAKAGIITAEIAPHGVTDPLNPTVQDTKITFTVTGLNSVSYYKFFLESADYSSWIKPSGGNLGDPLISDTNGALKFDFFYSPTHQAFSNTFVSEFYANFASAPQGYSKFLLADATFNKNYYYGYILIATPDQLWGS